MKVNIKEQIPKYLGDIKLLTTQCCLLEMEKLRSIESSLHGPLEVMKQFPLRRCGHEREPKPALKCFKALLGERNEHR